MRGSEIRTAKLELTDPFAGYWVIVRLNPPMRVFRDLSSGNLEKMLQAFAEISRSSNLTDESDQPIDVTTVAGWGEVTDDVLAHVAEKFAEAAKAPKAHANGSSTQPLPEKEASRPTSTT